MSTVALVVTILAGLAALVGFLSALYVYAKGARNEANLRSMERAITARDAEIEGQGLTIARHEATIATHETTIEQQGLTITRQHDEIQELRAERPSAEEIAHIKRTLDAHDATMRRTVEEWKAKFDDFVARWEAEHGTA